MSRRSTERPAKDAENVATSDFDDGDEETPMERFKTLTRRLLRVSPQELARQREKHAAKKDKS
jgi:hypothetical protein